MGIFTLTAASTGLTSVRSSSFTIKVGDAAVVFLVRQQPSYTIAGNKISPSVSVRVADQYGNPLSGFSVGVQTASGASLAPASTLTVSTNAAGVAVFSNLVETTAATYTLSASATGLTAATSNPFTVAPAQEKLTFAIPPRPPPSRALR